MKIIPIMAMVAIAMGCTSTTTTTPDARQLEFFQDEIDYYEKQYIDGVLEKDSLMMDTLGKIGATKTVAPFLFK